MTQREAAKNGKITEKMQIVAQKEGVSAVYIRDGIAAGSIVIPSNKNRNLEMYCAIGKGLRTKVNANIGSSLGCDDVALEIKKMRIAIDAGADTLMDLSTGSNIKKIRSRILKKSTVPVGTVPIYEIVANKLAEDKEIADITPDDILSCIEQQAQEGVDFFTIHCGVTQEALNRLREETRILDVVSRGGALLAQWMAEREKENPLYEYFDEIVDIAKKYDVTLSLGDGLRPGCLEDASDRAQITELITLGELSKRAGARGVQVIIEGPGHVPIHEIQKNVEMEKSLCDNAPFYVLGPIVTDIAAGYDHITSAIGGAIAASFGADFLCYVTPSEHLRLPNLEDVKEGLIATRIAAHAADIAKGIKGAREKDKEMSLARKKRDWSRQLKFTIDPPKAKEYRRSSMPLSKDVCSMCDRYCSIKIFDEVLRKSKMKED